MKNTPQLLLVLISLLIMLVGCGSIDSVPLPDNNPDDATTNAGADPTDEAGEATGTDDGDSSFDDPDLENFVVSLDSDRLLLPSRSLSPEQRFELYGTRSETTVPGEISPEGAANAPLEGLGDGVIENRVDGMTLSTWVLDSSWRQMTEVMRLFAICALSPRTPSKRVVHLPGASVEIARVSR